MAPSSRSRGKDQSDSSVHGPTRDSVIRSVVWAAWADAVGFIAELTDERGLKRRTRNRPLTEPLEWQRRVGGRFGVTMDLPRGCYSDDTQLRLATTRAISSQGFDVEAFAKVELPAWPAYALGGGRASKAAAVNLSKPTIPWFGNFYDGYTTAGGNGVAMRIQPHVWAAPLNTHQFVSDILRNGITTHGHPRALVGAVLNGLALAMAINEQHVPTPSDWPVLLEQIAVCLELVDEDTQLSQWRHVWQEHAKEDFNALWATTIDECRVMLDQVRPFVEGSTKFDETGGRNAYAKVVEVLGLAEPETRGSGTATVCAALAVAAAFPGDPYLASLVPATTIDTDTDTIATMVGAICGATATTMPPGEIQDLNYHLREADRLWDLREGGETGRAGEVATDFAYPDLLNWSPPRSQIDAVGIFNGTLALSGLALLAPNSTIKPVAGKDAVWLWTKTDFGQSMLVKMRPEPRNLPSNRTPPETRYIKRRPAGQGTADVETRSVLIHGQEVDPFAAPDLFSTDDTAEDPVSHMPDGTTERLADHDAAQADSDRSGHVPRPIDVDEMLRWVWLRDLNDKDLGYAIRRLAESGTIEQLIAFSTSLRMLVERRRLRDGK